MDINSFNEALYASSNGVVVERRRNTIVPILALLVGVAILVVNYFIENGSDANNLKSALVLIGGATTLVSVALCGVRIFGAGEPYHTVDKCFLVRKQYSFERTQHDSVIKAVEACDKLALSTIKESDIAAISVICYYSTQSKFCAMQAFTYEEFVYKSITGLRTKN
jgi:hypothetical protein